MNAILQAFGKLACGVTKKHVWGKAQRMSEDETVWYQKVCKRCSLVAPVKRRVKK
jgi:hypothetical protein